MEITKEKYNELIEAEMLLNSLYGAGVDSWDGWDVAIELFEEMKETYISLNIGEKNRRNNK